MSGCGSGERVVVRTWIEDDACAGHDPLAGRIATVQRQAQRTELTRFVDKHRTFERLHAVGVVSGAGGGSGVLDVTRQHRPDVNAGHQRHVLTANTARDVSTV